MDWPATFYIFDDMLALQKDSRIEFEFTFVWCTICCLDWIVIELLSGVRYLKICNKWLFLAMYGENSSFIYMDNDAVLLFSLLAASEKLITVIVNTLFYQTSLVNYSYQ